MDEPTVANGSDRVASANAVARIYEGRPKIGIHDGVDWKKTRHERCGRIELELPHDSAETRLRRDDPSVPNREHIGTRLRDQIDALMRMRGRSWAARAETAMRRHLRSFDGVAEAAPSTLAPDGGSDCNSDSEDPQHGAPHCRRSLAS
jgi:hypothetical protein